MNIEERQKLLEICTEIVFISNWIKNRFFTGVQSIKNEVKLYIMALKKIKYKSKQKKAIYLLEN